jgi:hypothetical protein
MIWIVCMPWGLRRFTTVRKVISSPSAVTTAGSCSRPMLAARPSSGHWNECVATTSSRFVAMWSIKGLADKGECIVAAKLCADSTVSNINGDNVNQDPMKTLYDAEACQAQAAATGGAPVCTSAGWNNVQRSGWLTNGAFQKAQECALDLTSPQ